MTEKKKHTKPRTHTPNPDGRPVENIVQPIRDTPENVAKAVMKKIKPIKKDK